MKRSVASAVLGIALVVAPAPARAAGTVQRFLLAAGANYGGSDRAVLKYGVSDAERFATVLLDLGGVPAANATMLKEPKLRDLLAALDQLSARVAGSRRTLAANGGGRIEVILYYSGHADEKGLLLADDRLSYRSLRDRLEQVAADVRIAVLDACESGAFTRRKGGRPKPAFLVDESATMQGYAFLTSSTATEAAQESDRIGASYFTHYLVSGLRGAADASGDGKVTLNEAYQFAFNETVGDTSQTRAGVQHPSYDIGLTGSGDVVMTDVRQATATLVLGEDLDGRVFIRNAAQQLVVELYKTAGHRQDVWLEPGSYDIRVERKQTLFTGKLAVATGARQVVEMAQLRVTAGEVARRRGYQPPPYAVAGRNRLDILLGMAPTPSHADGTATVVAGTDDGAMLAGLQFTRWFRENLAFTAAFNSLAGRSGSTVGPNGTVAGSSSVRTLGVGARWNPLRGDLQRQAAKPYLSASVGPVFGSNDGVTVTPQSVHAGTYTETAVGGLVGGGVDVHAGRHWSFGVEGGYHWMSNFSQPVGALRNYSGWQLTASVGWVFGKGY
jgi:hypothetical protein